MQVKVVLGDLGLVQAAKIAAHLDEQYVKKRGAPVPRRAIEDHYLVSGIHLLRWRLVYLIMYKYIIYAPQMRSLVSLEWFLPC